MLEEADVTVMLKDTALNRALAASFYSNSGGGLADLLSRALGLDGGGRELRLLDPPMVVTLGDGTLLATFGVEVSARVLGRRVEADVAATARLRAWVDGGAAVVEVQDLTTDGVGMGGWIEAPRLVVGAVDSVLRGYFGVTGRSSMVTEVPLPTVAVPSPVPNGPSLELHIVGLEVREGAVTVGLSAAPVGASVPVLNGESDVTIRVSEPFLEQLLLDSWEAAPHHAEVEKRIEVPDYRSFLDLFKGAVNLFLGRGWRKSQVRVDRSWVEADAEIDYGRPRLRLLDGGRVEITDTPLHLVAHVRPKMEAVATPRGAWKQLKEWLMPWRKIEKDRREVLDLANIAEEQDLHIVRALARLSIEPDGTVAVKIEDLELDMEVEWGLPSEVVERVSTWIMEQAAERFPPIRARLPLDEIMLPVLGVAPRVVLREMGGGPGHLDVHADLAFAEVPRPISPLPRFLADRGRWLVHREDCPSAHTVPEAEKVGFYSLYEAIEQGYRGCPDCLSAYQYIRPSETGGMAARQLLKAR